MNISIPARKIPILNESDVLVCGGGCSGIAAAISAARHGCRVTLLERWPSVGGMATNALVNGWHRSDRQKMVIYGLVEESVQRAAPHGWVQQDEKFPFAHETHWFDPEGMRIVWQRMLDEAGVLTICYQPAGEPIMQDCEIRGVEVDTKQGRKAILAKIVIDATGDGDLAAKAGVPFSFGRESDGMVQGMTLMYALRGIDAKQVDHFGETGVAALIEKMKTERDAGRFPDFCEGNTKTHLRVARDHSLWNMCPVAGNPLDELELSKLTAAAREKVVAYLNYWRKNMPGYQQAKIEQTAFTMGVRESRRIHGNTTLDAEMVLSARKQTDAVGHGIWMVDIHDPKGSGNTTFYNQSAQNMLPEGESYHIPLSMCLNNLIPNLAVVGRCAASTHEAHASIRVQTHCMAMAQGAGTAAALSLESGVPMTKIDIPNLQRRLKADGVYLEDIPERGKDICEPK